MATNLGTGSTRNGRDSHSKRLGTKVYGGQVILSGGIIVRQRGTVITDDGGLTTGTGRDHTIYAKKDGIVSFREYRRFGKTKKMAYIKSIEG
jgi:large subunit ribosomal protein L27